MFREVTLVAALVAAAGCSTSRDTRTSESDGRDAYPQTASSDRTGYDANTGPAGPTGAQGLRADGSVDPMNEAAHADDRNWSNARTQANEQLNRDNQWNAGSNDIARADNAVDDRFIHEGNPSDWTASDPRHHSSSSAAREQVRSARLGDPSDRSWSDSDQPADRWRAYRIFWFGANKSEIARADSLQFAEIAAFIKENPSARLGIDGAATPNAADEPRPNAELSERRILAVREGLIAAGVPADRISSGIYPDGERMRDGRVDILLDSPEVRSAARPGGARPIATPRQAQGQAERWNSYRDCWFDGNKADLRSSDIRQFEEIAAYMRANPSVRIGIEAPSNAAGDSDLSAQRLNAVRDALIRAGVPANRIDADVYADRRMRQEGRVTVLVTKEMRAAWR